MLAASGDAHMKLQGMTNDPPPADRLTNGGYRFAQSFFK
jgi:hypothetical protein